MSYSRRILITLCFNVLSIQILYSQQFTSTSDLRPYLLNLPLLESKDSMIKNARKLTRNNKIDSFIVISNTRVYILDSTIKYDYFSIQPRYTIFKIFELWSYDNPKNKDTTLIISLEGYYGNTSKAENNMFSEYHNTIDIFDEQFFEQKDYTLFGTNKMASGLKYFFKNSKKNEIFNVGWQNGDCFPNYSITISLEQKTN